ncbi:MAG: protein kinase, partial [Acidobacteria bacterium]|nr:protein kinase [Acidobacteriota bacterium]
LASLNHPNIATLYGLETGIPSGKETGTGTGENSKLKTQNSKLPADAGAVTFLAMELVEGEDLSERIKRGPIPVEEAVAMALQIAEALEAAHEQAIVHRDLKPANIKLRPDGTVKVLDFGLAKAWETETGDSSLSMSPTLTAHATAAGVILGTAAYMAPEQAAGIAADRRADVWAFGVVLWEMLTGNKLFDGETVSHVLASVLKDEADLDALPDETPARLRQLIERCLKKKSKQRLQAIGDARIELEDYVADPAAFAIESSVPASDSSDSATWKRSLPVTAAAVVVVALVAGVAGWSMRPAAPDRPLRKLEIPTDGVPRKAVLAPDGRHLAYISGGQLWLRDLERLESRPVPRSEGVETIFWSDDGAWLGFGSGTRIWKVPAEGAEPVVVAQVDDDFDWASGGVWSGDRIIFCTGDTGLLEVTARGGDPKLLLAPEEGEDDFHHLSSLPNGKGILFIVHGETGFNTLAVFAEGQRRDLLHLEGQSLETPFYSPTGHILFGRRPNNPGVWAVPFDLKKLEVTGESFLVAPEASWPSASEDGTLAFISGASFLAPTQLVWFDREGRELATIGQPGSFWPLQRLSPDGRRIVIPAGDTGELDLWVVDAERGTQTRLTFDEGSEVIAVWAPDGRRIAYRGNVGNERGIAIRMADGTGDPELLFADGTPNDFSPDGSSLIFSQTEEGTKRDLWTLPITAEGDPSPFIQTESVEWVGRIDPSGKYVAYVSDESGTSEIYIRPFPDAEGKWLVSVDGGFYPSWNPAGGELFFVQDQTVMVVDVETQPALHLGTPRPLFTMPVSGRSFGSTPDPFGVSPDGERFVVLRSEDSGAVNSPPPSVVIVDSWMSEFEEAE